MTKMTAAGVTFATEASATAELDRIATVINAPRRSHCESNRSFGWRLAVSITEDILAREELLARVLDMTKPPTVRS